MSTNTTPISSRPASPVLELEVPNTDNPVNELVDNVAQTHLQELTEGANNVLTPLENRNTIVLVSDGDFVALSENELDLLRRVRDMIFCQNRDPVCRKDMEERKSKLATWNATPRWAGDVELTPECKMSGGIAGYGKRLFKVENLSNEPVGFVIYGDRPDYAVENISTIGFTEHDPVKMRFFHYWEANKDRFVALLPGVTACIVTRTHQMAVSVIRVFANVAEDKIELRETIWQNRVIYCPHNKVTHLNILPRHIN